MPPHTGEIFRAFLQQGLTAFGGPIAHLGYFRREFVERRRWLDEAQFAQLLVVSQTLPGPASSQLGFSIGLLRGGWSGALAAFVGFTLPSALLMYLVALLGLGARGPLALTVVHALKLLAAIVVLDAILRMVRTLAPDLPRAALAAAAAMLVLLTQSPWAQVLAMAGAAALGSRLLHGGVPAEGALLPFPPQRRLTALLLAVFALGLGAAVLLPGSHASLANLAGVTWRAGSLVFGGGHVVLPLLEQGTVGNGWLPRESFLVGYGAAQLLPGPLFSFSAFLGASITTGVPAALAALVAVVAIFAPGFLLIAATLPVWGAVANHPRAARAIAGVNAAVVGLLVAALLDPVLPEAIGGFVDWLAVAAGLVLQRRMERPTFAVLAPCVVAALIG